VKNHFITVSAFGFLFPVCGMLRHFVLVIAAKERLYPVADATTFFTDMHYILRVLAAGDIRTVCHHRLNLLEQVIPLRLCFSLVCCIVIFDMFQTSL
jgi:hypothetical protein